ncbi:MAG: hypothetical protein HC921_15625 [Synechococcaceae cyanobacterium SM2_3_1]|nr:hypothetical protein [Synechococcaceae cyanobacterium SM2_3_1]
MACPRIVAASPTPASTTTEQDPQVRPQGGPLRIGNRTPHPLRLVALLRTGEQVIIPKVAHWDFAPGEGSRSGLLLSLGEDPLHLQAGDIVLGHSLDGTGQYWGPYLLGDSRLPTWSSAQDLWVLPFPETDLEELVPQALPQMLTSPQPHQPEESTNLAPRTGSLRLGNRTDFPVRVVVMLRSGDYKDQPQVFHWDFAANEGGSEGLPLSLEEDPLLISPGEIIMAFSLDGSQRYWGPNLVGESLSPFWEPNLEVWSMILQP